MNPSTARPNQISGLDAGLVPHREWAVSQWFYANRIWYYHRRRSAAHELRTDGRFYQLVDPLLREVCQLLNDAGLRTTPSCEGHSYPRQRFEQIWSELQREAPAIRGDGLIVKDCENEHEYLFGDADYRLPWPSFERFYQLAGAHQTLGYLGMLASPPSQPLAQRLARKLNERPLSGVRVQSAWSDALGGLLLDVHVNVGDAQQRATTWQQVTRRVRQVVAND